MRTKHQILYQNKILCMKVYVECTILKIFSRLSIFSFSCKKSTPFMIKQNYSHNNNIYYVREIIVQGIANDILNCNQSRIHKKFCDLFYFFYFFRNISVYLVRFYINNNIVFHSTIHRVSFILLKKSYFHKFCLRNK